MGLMLKNQIERLKAAYSADEIDVEQIVREWEPAFSGISDCDVEAGISDVIQNKYITSFPALNQVIPHVEEAVEERKRNPNAAPQVSENAVSDAAQVQRIAAAAVSSDPSEAMESMAVHFEKRAVQERNPSERNGFLEMAAVARQSESFVDLARRLEKLKNNA